MATTIKDNRVIPSALSERWEMLVKEAGKRIFDRRKKLITAVGDRPYRGVPTNEAEARQTWAQMRRDPEAIMEMLAENVRMKPAGGILFPKALIERLYDMEKDMPGAKAKAEQPDIDETVSEFVPRVVPDFEQEIPDEPTAEDDALEPEGIAGELEQAIEEEVPSDEDEPDPEEELGT